MRLTVLAGVASGRMRVRSYRTVKEVEGVLMMLCNALSLWTSIKFRGRDPSECQVFRDDRDRKAFYRSNTDLW